MSEGENIEQNSEDGKSERPEEMNEHISPEQVIVSPALLDQTSEIPKSKSKTWKYIIIRT